MCTLYANAQVITACLTFEDNDVFTCSILSLYRSCKYSNKSADYCQNLVLFDYSYINTYVENSMEMYFFLNIYTYRIYLYFDGFTYIHSIIFVSSMKIQKTMKKKAACFHYTFNTYATKIHLIYNPSPFFY